MAVSRFIEVCTDDSVHCLRSTKVHFDNAVLRVVQQLLFKSHTMNATGTGIIAVIVFIVRLPIFPKRNGQKRCSLST